MRKELLIWRQHFDEERAFDVDATFDEGGASDVNATFSERGASVWTQHFLMSEVLAGGKWREV